MESFGSTNVELSLSILISLFILLQEYHIKKKKKLATAFIIQYLFQKLLKVLFGITPISPFPTDSSQHILCVYGWQVIMKGDGLLFKVFITDEILHN